MLCGLFTYDFHTQNNCQLFKSDLHTMYVNLNVCNLHTIELLPKLFMFTLAKPSRSFFQKYTLFRKGCKVNHFKAKLSNRSYPLSNL